MKDIEINIIVNDKASNFKTRARTEEEFNEVINWVNNQINGPARKVDRLTYKSESGDYGYARDFDMYSTETKNYIGQLEDNKE